MANTLHTFHPHVWADIAFRKIYGIKSFSHRIKRDPFEVITSRYGNTLSISSSAYSASVEMRDKWWWYFTGKTWENEVRVHQQKAFEAAYLKHKENEILDYKVSRLA